MTSTVGIPITASSIGEVVARRHAVVIVEGLTGIKPGQLVKFETGSLGQVAEISQTATNVMAFQPEGVTVGHTATPLDTQLTIPVSAAYLGSFITPLGETLFGNVEHHEPVGYLVDDAPPLLSQRASIKKPMVTGVSVIDLLLPLGMGQRQIIAGDRKTGKTQFAMKLAVNQAHQGNVVIYAVISKPMAEAHRIWLFFEEMGVKDQLVMVGSFPHQAAPLIIQTPLAAMAIAEYFRDRGQNTVIILDDLSAHAEAHRELALLNKQFPGRDSYPGNIFFEHARLLERAGNFVHPQDPSQDVSISCLPIAETTESNLTNYIVSNLISITDGHLLFDIGLFQQGRRPAVHPGLSVTRVGKQTQGKLERDITRQLTTFFSKFSQAENVTHFAAEVSQETQTLLRRGNQLSVLFSEQTKELLEQPTRLTLVSMIWHGWLANVKTQTLKEYRKNLQHQYLSNDQVKTVIDRIYQEPESFRQLLEVTKQHQAVLLEACQVSLS